MTAVAQFDFLLQSVIQTVEFSLDNELCANRRF
jgi:hypothetical protein